MSEFSAVVNALAKNNEEERERDSNMNRNIAFQAEQTRDATVQGFTFLADTFDGMKDDFVSAVESTTDAVNLNAPKPDGGAAKEDKNREQNLFKRMIKGLTDIKDSILKKPVELAKKGFDFLKNLAFGGFILAALMFLQSPYWEKTKVLIKEYVIPLIRGVFDAFTGIGDDLNAFLEDPSIETFLNLFKSSGIIIGTIVAMTALFNPFGLRGLLFRGISKAAGAFLGLFRKGGAVRDGIDSQTKRMKGRGVFAGLRRGLTSMMGAFSGLGTSLMDMATGTKRDADGRLRSTGKKGVTGGAGPAGRFASGAGRGIGAVAKGAAKMIPGVGLIATAAFGIFDAVSAGLDEAKKETATAGSIAKESVAGLLSGLTFGLVSRETISNGITKIGEGISSGITAVKDGVMGVINDPAGAFNAVTGKINELTGLSLPDFETSKESILAFGQSMKDKAANLVGKFEEFTGINIPTFSEAKDSLSKIGTDLMGKFINLSPLNLLSFSEAKDSLSKIGTDLMGKFDGLMDSVSLEGAKSALSGLGDSLSKSFSSFKNGVMGLFKDDRTDEQKLKAKIDALAKDVATDSFFETDKNRQQDKEELARLREQYAKMIGAGGGGSTTVVNNYGAPAPAGGGGGGGGMIVPDSMSNNNHPRRRRGR